MRDGRQLQLVRIGPELRRPRLRRLLTDVHPQTHQIESQANRTIALSIRVRQHADGRTIVYGVYDYDTHWQHEKSRAVRVGVMAAPGSDLPAAIQQVGEHLAARLDDDARGSEHLRDVVAECIADLPAEEL